MEGPRAPTTAEFSEVVTFLNSHLRASSQWSIADEYPTTLTLQNLHNFRIIKDQNKILSHALVKPVVVKTRRGLFKVGCIGSVVTSEEHRSNGLSQAVLNECLAVLKQQGCDIAILWTDLFDFYRKVGFELGGSEVSLLIDKPLINNSNLSFKFMDSNKIDPQALYRIYSQHSVGSIRTLDEFEKYLKIPNSRLYTAWTPEGKIDSYAVEGKGADLQGYIHEWGGTVEGLTSLLAHIRNTINKPLTLITPAHSQAIIRKLESLGAKRVDGYLGMIKILNPESLFTKVIRNARQEWGIQNFILEKRGNLFQFGIGEEVFQTEHEADMVRLLFGPQKPSELFNGGDAIISQLDKFLPLEMWLWGWDSV